MTRLFVGTDDGLFDLDGQRLLGGRVNALARDGWAVIDGNTVVRESVPGKWDEVATLAGNGRTAHRPMLARRDHALVGHEDAVVWVSDAGETAPVLAFDAIAGREGWHAVGSARPYVRSLTETLDGVLLANVHVGGIPRSADGGASWQPTIDVDADVHQVRAHPARAGVAFFAAAVGVGISRDGGASWTVHTEGLHATYCRAVTAVGDAVLVTASTGPFTDRSAVYRRAIDDDTMPFEQVSQWLPHNIDTECLAAGDGDGTAAFGGPDGRLHQSSDGGRTWAVSEGFPPITALAYARA
jgi:hypothetical protein